MISINMQLIRANLNYKPQSWVTICGTCGSEIQFTMKDTHLYVYGVDCKREYYIQCPYCGVWIKTNVKPIIHDPLNKSF